MILPDVNVLIGAFRGDSVHHSVCKPFLEASFGSAKPFGLSLLTVAALIRITTNPRFHVQASTTAEGLAFADAVLAQPSCIVVEPGPGHWRIFADLLQRTNARAKLVSDAWYAALAIEHGCEWVTLDKDFAKFPGLKWRHP